MFSAPISSEKLTNVNYISKVLENEAFVGYPGILKKI